MEIDSRSKICILFFFISLRTSCQAFSSIVRNRYIYSLLSMQFNIRYYSIGISEGFLEMALELSQKEMSRTRGTEEGCC